MITLSDVIKRNQNFDYERFSEDMLSLSKGECEVLLGNIQSEIIKGGDEEVLYNCRSMVLDRINDIEKGKYNVGDPKPGQPHILWTDLGNGKFDWKSKNGKWWKGKQIPSQSSNNGGNSQQATTDNKKTASMNKKESWWDNIDELKKRIKDPLIRSTAPHLVIQMAERVDELEAEKKKNAHKITLDKVLNTSNEWVVKDSGGGKLQVADNKGRISAVLITKIKGRYYIYPYNSINKMDWSDKEGYATSKGAMKAILDRISSLDKKDDKTTTDKKDDKGIKKISSIFQNLTNDFLYDYLEDWLDDEDKKKITDEQLNLLEQLYDIYESSSEDEIRLISVSNKKTKTSEKKIAKIIADAEKDGNIVIEYGNDKNWNAIIMSKDKFNEIDLSSDDNNSNNYPAPNKAKITSKQQQQLNEVVDKGFLISKNTYNDTSKMKLERTSSGNWRCYYDGKDTGNTISGKLMSESLARKLDMYQVPVFKGNVIDAIKSSDLFNKKMGVGIESINVGEPDSDSGKIYATVIYATAHGSYKSVTVSVNAEGKVEKKSGWQSSQAFANVNDAKSYVEYGRRGKNTFNLKWEDL